MWNGTSEIASYRREGNVTQRVQTSGRGAPVRRTALLAPTLLGLLAPLAAAHLGGSAARLALLLGYPYPHDGLEGTLLHEARLLRDHGVLYPPLELHSFVSAPYPPLHVVALALADTYAGPHVFWSGRLISLLCALLAAALAALTVRRATGAWAAGLISAALLLSAPPVLLWATRVKPDLMALAWTALGLLFTTRALADDGPKSADRRPPTSEQRLPSVPRFSPVLLAALCFAGAHFTKQTDVTGPLAAGLALLAADGLDWRAGRVRASPGLPIRPRTAAFAFAYLTLTLGGWALLDALTGGGYTLHVWWNFERTSWWSPGLFRKIAGLLSFWWPAILMSLAAVLLAPRSRAMLPLAAYAIVSPLTLLLAGETGANHNHLLESHLALALGAGAALGCAICDQRRGWALGVPLAALAALQFALAFSPPAWYTNQLAPHDPPARFLALMRATPGEILADDTGLLLQAGKPLRYDDPSTMGPAASTGFWDQRGLLADIAARRFSAIMIPVNAEDHPRDPSGRWTPEMLAAIRAHYRLAYRDTIYTFVPR